RLIALDVQAAFDGDPAAIHTDEVVFCYPGLEAILSHRIAHALTRLHVPLLPRLIQELAHNATGIDIHPGATIGESFFIDHGTGVVIGETTVIGDHCRIYQGVTLGAKSFQRDETGRLVRGVKRHPTIGNRVTIYAGAVILGGDTVIGDDCVINGSVFLTRSVPPGHIVRQKSPELVMRSNPMNR
ncbi:MAG: serine acetyltransferase, partial [Actinobacteria bacterium]|nr:serine acetyltransferase [Actinomycetota bacterium]